MATAASGPNPEALTWLRQSPPPFGVSMMHKETCSVMEGIQFVETLYALGALRVTVPAWAIRQYPPGWSPAGRHQGGLVTCAFEVTLPDSGPDREALIWFIANQCPDTARWWGPSVPLAVFRSRVGCKTVVMAWV